jgi:hypothetical protein
MKYPNTKHLAAFAFLALATAFALPALNGSYPPPGLPGTASAVAEPTPTATVGGTVHRPSADITLVSVVTSTASQRSCCVEDGAPTVAVTIRVTNTTKSDMSAAYLSVYARYGADGVVATSFYDFEAGINGIPASIIPAGGSITGTVGFVVPEGVDLRIDVTAPRGSDPALFRVAV